MDFEFNGKNEIMYSNRKRVVEQWDKQPSSQRASNFKSSSRILKLALNKKTPKHLNELLDAFLMGFLPHKSDPEKSFKIAICRSCGSSFKNLDHFGECSTASWTRETIYAELGSNSKRRILDMLKFIKGSVCIRTTLPQTAL